MRKLQVKILSLGLIVLLVASCASFELGNLNPKSRRAKYIASHTASLNADTISAIRNGNNILGMAYAEVVASIGKPYHINRTTGSYGIREQWVMCAPNSMRDRRYGYVYFENSKVISWQSR